MQNKQLTLGSLFDGSGGFPLGGLLAGITPVWASEIEPFPIRVTTKRMPWVKHYGDISQMDGGKIEPVDIITFGSPCQDMSVAGKRSGLDGSRSSLFYEAIRIIKEMRCATNGKYPRFPMFTSCCPAWVKYLENHDPKYLKNISTCKSPMEMFASIVREYYQTKDAEDGRETYQVAIMPCTAKKMEAARDEFTHDGKRDVDLVITTRELIDMIRESGIDLPKLELESPDLPFGLGSGAAAIYGVTGGVAEAVVRHCFPDKSKNAMREIALLGLRGDEPIREATVSVGDAELKLAVVNGLVNARKLLKEMDEGKKFYHLVEVMTCQGGCVGGAGQPHALHATKVQRGEGLYDVDRQAMFKRAERNPIVTKMLADMGEEKAHELLHVSYVKEDENAL